MKTSKQKSELIKEALKRARKVGESSFVFEGTRIKTSEALALADKFELQKE